MYFFFATFVSAVLSRFAGFLNALKDSDLTCLRRVFPYMQVELEFGNVGFCGERKSEEPGENLRSQLTQRVSCKALLNLWEIAPYKCIVILIVIKSKKIVFSFFEFFIFIFIFLLQNTP